MKPFWMIIILNLFISYTLFYPSISSFNNLKNSQNDVLITSCSELDTYVEVEAGFHALISPWTWNITSYKNSATSEKINLSCDPIEGYQGKIASTNLTIYTGQILKLSFTAEDTDSGIGIWNDSTGSGYSEAVWDDTAFLDESKLENASLYNDLFGGKINYKLQPKTVTTLYLQAPSTPRDLFYRETFFSGAGHFGMFGWIQVIQRSDGSVPTSINLASDLNCNTVDRSEQYLIQLTGILWGLLIFGGEIFILVVMIGMAFSLIKKRRA